MSGSFVSPFSPAFQVYEEMAKSWGPFWPFSATLAKNPALGSSTPRGDDVDFSSPIDFSTPYLGWAYPSIFDFSTRSAPKIAPKFDVTGQFPVKFGVFA